MTIYTITIKINKKGPTEEQYHSVLDQLYSKFGILVEDMVYETDKKYNLHLHGIFHKEDKFTIKQIVKDLKVHIFITKIESLSKLTPWLKYLEKQKYKQHSILTLNPYYHRNMFQEDSN